MKWVVSRWTHEFWGCNAPLLKKIIIKIFRIIQKNIPKLQSDTKKSSCFLIWFVDLPRNAMSPQTALGGLGLDWSSWAAGSDSTHTESEGVEQHVWHSTPTSAYVSSPCASRGAVMVLLHGPALSRCKKVAQSTCVGWQSGMHALRSSSRSPMLTSSAHPLLSKPAANNAIEHDTICPETQIQRADATTT